MNDPDLSNLAGDQLQYVRELEAEVKLLRASGDRLSDAAGEFARRMTPGNTTVRGRKADALRELGAAQRLWKEARKP